MSRLRVWVLGWLWRQWAGREACVGACANRRWRQWKIGNVEFTFTTRRLGIKDGYAREDLVEMLRTIRKHERIMGWKVPEPETDS